MDIKKIIGVVIGIGLAVAGVYFGYDFKKEVCGGPVAAEPVSQPEAK